MQVKDQEPTTAGCSGVGDDYEVVFVFSNLHR